MKRLGRIAHTAFAVTLNLFLFFSAPVGAAADARVALVIGNAAYKDAALLNPVNDARDMATRLRQLGFDVVVRENATRANVASAIAEFTARLTPSSTALFYYAGHGIQVRGRNFLIPVDAAIESESSVAFTAIDVAQINDEIEQTGVRVRLIVLDACRNNPFEKKLRGVGQSRGLAAMDAARGSLVAFATAPGSVAADGDGSNSVYTGALLKALSVPGLKAEEVFKRARLSVLEETRGQQTPWEQSALTGDLVLNNGVAEAPVAAAPPAIAPAAGAVADPELLFWQSAQASNRAEEYEAYLRQYPQGAFAALARFRVAMLKAAPAQPTLAAKPVAPPRPEKPAAAMVQPLPDPRQRKPADAAPAGDSAVLLRVVAREQDPQPPASTAPSEAAEAMMRRADQLAAVGDLGAARLFYERLAVSGHAAAALALARSYDPAWLRQRGTIGAPGDPARAAQWYARADALAQRAVAAQ